MDDIIKRLDAQGVILSKILDQTYKIDRVEQMVEHIYLDMTNKASWIEFKQLQHKVADLEAEIEKLKKAS
jgi:hypothetical protein